VSVDVVGAGVIGLAVAWRLARDGVPVTVHDDAPGSGPSRVAAGMLAPVTEASFGEGTLAELMLAARARWPEFAASLRTDTGLELGYRDEGTLLVGADAGDLAEIERIGRFYAASGLAATPLTARECREREPLLAPRIRGGLFVPGDHQVDPRRLHAALLAAVTARGVVIQPRRVPALRDLDGDTVVLAAGCGSAALAGLPVRPVRGQVLRLREPSGATPGFHHVVRAMVTGRSVYLVPRRDGEVVVGATSDERAEPRPTAGDAWTLLDNAVRLVPELAEYVVAEHTVGHRPGTPDNAPLLGRLDDRLIVATGHYRHGILLAPITADVVSALVTGAAPPVPLHHFDPGRFGDAHHPQRPVAPDRRGDNGC
jgi:glycine oxidase